MSIEAELKAVVRDPEHVHGMLRQRATEDVSVYRDIYFDRPNRELTRSGQELRLRTIMRANGGRTLLTYKDQPVDSASNSKPEYETEVADAEVLDAVLSALGFEHVISFEKHCSNFIFDAYGRKLQATLATVPELDDTFLEIETQVNDRSDVAPALEVVRRVLGEFGIADSDLSNELYTDAVMARRALRGP